MKIKLDDLQFKIMNVLWQLEEASVHDVRDALKSDKELAVTTVGTVLSRLEKKDMIAHRKEGRQFIYRALISEDQAKSSMLSTLTNQLFKGDTAGLVNHLISENDFDESDLSDIEKMIQEYKSKKK